MRSTKLAKLKRLIYHAVCHNIYSKMKIIPNCDISRKTNVDHKNPSKCSFRWNS